MKEIKYKKDWVSQSCEIEGERLRKEKPTDLILENKLRRKFLNEQFVF